MLPGIEYNANPNSDSVVSSFGVVTVGKLGPANIVGDVLKFGQDDKGFVSTFAYEVSKHRCYDRELKGLTKKVAY